VERGNQGEGILGEGNRYKETGIRKVVKLAISTSIDNT